ncbi:MAG: CerR family C-terminal domain-containing protein [Candidatus Binatia bacterium]
MTGLAAPQSASDTKARVLQAAARLFAERGFRGTTAREIAERAGVNLAAAHYHFGSKEALYIEVLRAQFDALTSELTRRRARLPAGSGMRRPALIALLRRRIAAMLELLLGPAGRLHGALMLRELCDPSDALPHIVARFIAPMKLELEAIVAALAPHLGPAAIERCVFSIVGQVFFYRTHLPVLRQMLAGRDFDAPALRAIAAHIAVFSLGGMERLAHEPRRRRPR